MIKKTFYNIYLFEEFYKLLINTNNTFCPIFIQIAKPLKKAEEYLGNSSLEPIKEIKM